MNQSTSLTDERMIERWTFPIGESVAMLVIENKSGKPLEPEDMDALYEASLLFKKQLVRRSQMRRKLQPEYEI